MNSLDAANRHAQILSLLQESGRMSVNEIIQRLDTSPATARRDLKELERADKLIRVHGGVLLADKIDGEASFQRKRKQHALEKEAIAFRAADLVPENAHVFIDSGSTCLELGKLLFKRADLTIYTNSVPLLNSSAAPSAQVIGLGGELRSISQAMVGVMTLKWIQMLNLDVAFLGASSLDPELGAFTTEFSESGIKSCVMERSKKSVLLSDSAKWEASASVLYSSWESFDLLITDKSKKQSESPGSQKVETLYV